MRAPGTGKRSTLYRMSFRNVVVPCPNVGRCRERWDAPTFGNPNVGTTVMTLGQRARFEPRVWSFVCEGTTVVTSHAERREELDVGLCPTPGLVHVGFRRPYVRTQRPNVARFHLNVPLASNVDAPGAPYTVGWGVEQYPRIYPRILLKILALPSAYMHTRSVPPEAGVYPLKPA